MDEGRGRAVDVLVVDDNPGDRRFITEALRNSQLDLTIHTVDTRDEALDLVYRRGEYEDAPRLDVILLDWRLSRTTGKEVLNAAKSGGSHTAVVVMTGSKTGRDSLKSSFSRADMYIEKPIDPEGYTETLRSFLPDQ